MKYLIETYGCQMNKAESAALQQTLHAYNWEETQEIAQADFVIINTCVVRATAENRAWSRIKQLCALKKQKHFYLLITGCLAENQKNSIQTLAPEVDFVLGNFQKNNFEAIVQSIDKRIKTPQFEEKPVYQFSTYHGTRGALQALVPISHGCNNFCTYCIVPYVRGRETARSPESILYELDALAANGVREITLIGQNVNSYQWNDATLNIGFAKLLDMIAEHCKHTAIQRIRFLTSHPKDLSFDIINIMKKHEIIAKHLHLCVQHGSDTILKAMNRHYTSEHYLNLVQLLRKEIPEITLSTDILIGFPGEIEEDVTKTIELMKQAQFIYSFMYYYNPRKGTPAASMPNQIPVAQKKERLARIIAVQKELTRTVMQKFIGKKLIVLVEGISKRKKTELLARTEQDIMVCFEGDQSLIGKFCMVDISSISGNTFKGKLLQVLE
ncbi:MAG TPA: tRNA (N6-isopentenyl adenosine(37)-C2)-methylthiotransferase MiaB [Spirochaetales bacterium]|nr:tRNA (N6-isopentenyl adenosine(37)-C2)-methylthiotransferase MiaB [Spirochaetales bacterium]